MVWKANQEQGVATKEVAAEAGSDDRRSYQLHQESGTFLSRLRGDIRES